jgi:hypothetical protein
MRKRATTSVTALMPQRGEPKMTNANEGAANDGRTKNGCGHWLIKLEVQSLEGLTAVLNLVEGHPGVAEVRIYSFDGDAAGERRRLRSNGGGR